MATRDEYADKLRERETPFTAGPPTIAGLIRAVDISTIGDDAAFRHEVRAILDAYDVVMDERLTQLRQRAARPSADALAGEALSPRLRDRDSPQVVVTASRVPHDGVGHPDGIFRPVRKVGVLVGDPQAQPV
jgi:hypothetical protein